LIPVHATKAFGGVELEHHSSLTSELDAGELSSLAHRPPYTEECAPGAHSTLG